MACDVKVVEDGKIALVEFNDAGPFGGNDSHVVLYFVENLLIVDVDVFV